VALIITVVSEAEPSFVQINCHRWRWTFTVHLFWFIF